MGFLRVLLRTIRGKLLLTREGSPLHPGQPITDFLTREAAKRLHVERLPGTPRPQPRRGPLERSQARGAPEPLLPRSGGIAARTASGQRALAAPSRPHPQLLSPLRLLRLEHKVAVRSPRQPHSLLLARWLTTHRQGGAYIFVALRPVSSTRTIHEAEYSKGRATPVRTWTTKVSARRRVSARLDTPLTHKAYHAVDCRSLCY